MKNRNILFGYCYRNGEIKIQEENIETLKYIREAYLNGKSLLQIAEILNKKSVEYACGVTGWNTARIMRLLDEKKYLGNAVYPATLDNDTYEKIQRVKQSRNNQKNTDRKNGIYSLSLPICCAKCGAQLKRHINLHRAIPVRWYCKNPLCKTAITKSDESLLNDIVKLLNRMIEDPDKLTTPPNTEIESNEKRRYTEEKIADLIKASAGNNETVQKKLFESAARKYIDSDSSKSHAQKLRDIFTESAKMSLFSNEMLIRTTNSIKLYANGVTGLILDNGQEINTEE